MTMLAGLRVRGNRQHQCGNRRQNCFRSQHVEYSFNRVAEIRPAPSGFAGDGLTQAAPPGKARRDAARGEAPRGEARAK